MARKKKAYGENSTKSSDSPAASKTLFIRNLPFDVSSENLLDAFKIYGPIHSGFVVTDSISKKSRGIGYVRFADGEDATKALKQLKTVGNRKVFISYAQKRQTDSSTAASTSVSKPHRPAATASHKLIVRNLPFKAKEDQLRQLFSGVGEVVDITIPTQSDGRPKGFGFVSFEQRELGEKAITELHSKEYEGRQLSVDWFKAPSEHNLSKKKASKSKASTKTEQKTGKSNYHKVIIRNIPFEMSSDEMKKSLSKYGEVEKVDIPRQGGKKRGFSFITFNNKESAERLVRELKELNKRPVAVDWALDKSKYISQVTKGESNGSTSPTKKIDSSRKTLQKTEPTGLKSKKGVKNSKQTDIDIESGSDDDLDNESGSDDDLDNESGSEDELDNESGSDDDLDNESGSEMSDDEFEMASASGDNSATGEDFSEDDSKSDEDCLKKSKRSFKTSSADISQERTLFLRNVGYDTTEEQLMECFSNFGQVSYVKVLIDAATERSRGMGFVQYKRKADADKCLQAAQDPQQRSELTVDGRELNVALAVSREKITEISKAKEKQPKDKRNLYLAREGLIRAGTKAAEGVSKTDMNRRAKLETTMRAKLKDPLIFISPTRICVHNLPTKVTDKQLKAICIKAASEHKSVKVTECRIMRDMNNLNSEGVGKSRGFGFVSFTTHQHALAALRNLNNNPQIFTNEKRPIVEFSLENTRALQAKERRLHATKSLLTGNKPPTAKSEKAAKLATKGTDVQVERPKGIKPGLPSHHGPKVRHKPRPSALVDPKKEARLLKKRKEREFSRLEKEENQQPKPKKKKMEVVDSFDRLVDSYRNKMTAGASTKAKSKWFE